MLKAKIIIYLWIYFGEGLKNKNCLLGKYLMFLVLKHMTSSSHCHPIFLGKIEEVFADFLTWYFTKNLPFFPSLCKHSQRVWNSILEGLTFDFHLHKNDYIYQRICMHFAIFTIFIFSSNISLLIKVKNINFLLLLPISASPWNSIRRLKG